MRGGMGRREEGRSKECQKEWSERVEIEVGGVELRGEGVRIRIV